MICPVVTYAPTAATKPNIAAQPLKRSASGVMIKISIGMLMIVTGFMKLCKVIFSFFAIFYFLVKIMPSFCNVATEMCKKLFFPIKHSKKIFQIINQKLIEVLNKLNNALCSLMKFKVALFF